ncbi:MAG: DUF333 domain-containing protein [Patescibacteria group bacterium]|jgi:putative hemolysin
MNTKKYLLPVLAILVLAGAGCTGKSQKPNANDQTGTSTTVVQGTTDDSIAKDTALSNPATVYCLQEGGKFTMRKTLDGSTEGICELDNNIKCEEWAYYKGDCPAGSKHDKTATSTQTTTTTKETVGGQGTVTSDQPVIVSQDPEDTEDSKESKLELTVEAGDPGEIVNKWKTNGLKSTGGFIVILSGKPGITGLGKYNHILNNPDSRSFVWTDLVAGRAYYFRVCLNLDGECGAMSPEQQATAE